MELAGTPLHPEEIGSEIYLLAAEEDHIVPWTSAYKATQLFTGDVRFVLCSSGHVAGIVNPPSPKARYWVRRAAGRPGGLARRRDRARGLLVAAMGGVGRGPRRRAGRASRPGLHPSPAAAAGPRTVCDREVAEVVDKLRRC